MTRIHGGIYAQFAMINLNTNRKNADIADRILIGQRTVKPMGEHRPCPFCGGRVMYVRDPMDCAEIKGIYCLGYNALVKWNIEVKKNETFGETETKWLDKWNRRAGGQE